MKKNQLLIMLCGALIILVALIGVLAALLVGQGNGGDLYQKQLDLGKKYVEKGDYDQAILAFRSAIDANPADESAYYELAMLYKQLDRMQDMKYVLEQGIAKTASSKLQQLYDQFFSSEVDSGQNGSVIPVVPGNTGNHTNNGGQGNEKPLNQTIYINHSVCDVIANYTYREYVSRYSGINSVKNDGVYRYTFTNFEGTLYFFNTSSGTSISLTGDPYDTVRPNYVIFDSLKPLFNGANDNTVIPADGINSLGAKVLKATAYDSELGNYCSFLFSGCVFDVALSEDGTFNMNSAHRLYSQYGMGSSGMTQTVKYTNTLKIVSATTGEGVADAKVSVYKDGNLVYEATADSYGNCSLELEVGKYKAKVFKEGFINEECDLEVYSSGILSVSSLTISPELGSEQVRIVLTWGSYPVDLDSHLLDSNGNQLYFRNSKLYENGNVVAELDVDDVTGYGPETITVLDTSKDFTYYVHDFTKSSQMFTLNDVTVKVYTSDSSAPTVYTITPSGSQNNGWCVFSYVNGRIVTRNTEVAGAGQFVHQP